MTDEDMTFRVREAGDHLAEGPAPDRDRPDQEPEWSGVLTALRTMEIADIPRSVVVMDGVPARKIAPDRR